MAQTRTSALSSGALEDFLRGQAVRAQEYLGSHPACVGGKDGYRFRVWAPNAASVSLIGDFNGWDESLCPLSPVGGGVWETFIPDLRQYDAYKYAIHTGDGRTLAKADPYAFHAETRPGTASKLYDLAGYQWGDQNWMAWRKANPIYQNPLNIYEVHLGSWRRTGEDEFLSYRDIARYLVPYVKRMGFTHVELLPITEHPLDASWGYQCTGYFAATSRFGTPHDLMYLIDQLHQAGVGVLLDWVPAHFPKDAFGLYEFDGTPCYEYADPRKGEHADWGTRVFDYGRPEVRSFLFSSALFWLEQYHIDGLRVDAVASMLYLDYGREDGQWTPNVFGGHENLEAVDFLQQLNGHIFLAQPDVLMIAEESTAWPRVSHPVGEGGLEGGLGFNLKWNMGWMNDILHYIKLDPYFRQFNHKDITFSLMYAFSENFVLPLSHDEVVHMKGSLLNKMPGTDEEKYAGVRAFYTYMLAHPGKKLLMMGSEFGQWNEWHYEHSLDWHLLDMDNEDGERHRRLQAFFQAANAFYLEHRQLWELDFSWEGFQWICADDSQGNCAAFLRRDQKGNPLLVVCNFSPVHRDGYVVGVPFPGRYECVFNTDAEEFGGAGLGDREPLKSSYTPCHGQEQSIRIDLPPMSAVLYRCAKKFPPRRKKAGPTAKPPCKKGPNA
ncbi:1,4-alpha-glucan branching protein GlgB [Lawsonibacter celer]|jgi:1,4-alpha-glucan branching enzyme|uniref:1,4-alpha-glucan branching protein GlgB n=1 Tax=Lawsonibacter celer TaxID=2986526 RepID=UPI0016489C74|nr:1,4-alpha-glucan branching protein GlgB [Lawsonibacter celer]